MGFRATLKFGKVKVALNPMHRMFFNFAKSASVHSQDVKMQNLQTSLFKHKGMSDLINKLVDQKVSLPLGSELLQEVTDAFALF